MTRAAMASRFKVMRFMGLISKTGRSRSENQIQNPKAFILIAFDALVIAKNCHSVGERVPINVHESGAKEGDCGVDGIDGDGDIDGESGCG